MGALNLGKVTVVVAPRKYRDELRERATDMALRANGTTTAGAKLLGCLRS